MSGQLSQGVQSNLFWLGIVRLGLVQTALGAIVVITTATLNRVMVVEMQLPATVPGMLVALHYFVQLLRPRLGHGSDVGQRRTPWIIGGMAVLAAGAILAAVATTQMKTNLPLGAMLAVLAYGLIGVGVGAAGTSLLVLVASSVAPQRRAPAASVMWIMMISGFVITAALTGHVLDPFSPARLVMVCSAAAGAAFLLALVAVWRIEPRVNAAPAHAVTHRPTRHSFAHALALVWSEQRARRFTIFIFVSMLAYSAQDLILEPFAGLVFGMTLGQSTKLSALQNGGVLVGMIVVAVTGYLTSLRLSLRTCTIAGCLLSAAALLLIVVSGSLVWTGLLRAAVVALGFGNGIFAVAAIGSMMEQAGSGHSHREGVRVGLWGAAQALAFALGGLIGAAGVDLGRSVSASPLVSYAAVFVFDALLFVLAARLAIAVDGRTHGSDTTDRAPALEFGTSKS